MSESEPLVVTLSEAARMLGISPRWAAKLVERDEFPVPVKKLGPRRRVVGRAALLAYIEEAA